MEKIRHLQGAIYHTQCEFGNIDNFVSVIEPFFKGERFERKDATNKIDELINKLRDIENKKIGQKEALHLLLSNDLERIRSVVENIKIEDPTEDIYSIYDIYQKKLDEFNIDTEATKLYVVDKFPKPFDREAWAAFNADKADEERYGVHQGIYFRKRSIIPLYTFYLLSHELIHVAIGLKNPYLLGNGLEEGICDIFGILYLNMGILDKDVCKNLALYHRFKYEDEWIGKIYLDTLRQAMYIYKRFGLKGLAELIKGGREKIKQIEKYCLKGEFEKINLKEGTWIKDLTDMVDYFSIYPTGLLVSPLAKYIAEKIEEGDKIEDVVKGLNIKRDEGEKAIRELQDRISIILLDDQKVGYSSIPTLRETYTLRYSIPTKGVL